MVQFLSNGCVRIGTITLEISFGCQQSPRTSGLLRDNQNFLLGEGSLNTLLTIRGFDEVEALQVVSLGTPGSVAHDEFSTLSTTVTLVLVHFSLVRPPLLLFLLLLSVPVSTVRILWRKKVCFTTNSLSRPPFRSIAISILNGSFRQNLCGTATGTKMVY